MKDVEPESLVLTRSFAPNDVLAHAVLPLCVDTPANAQHNWSPTDERIAHSSASGHPFREALFPNGFFTI